MSCVGSLRYDMGLSLKCKYVKILLTTKMIQHSESMQKTQFQTKKSTLSISTILSDVILHARLFVTGQLRNPWQTLAEPLGSAEPWLKNTGVGPRSSSMYRVKINLSSEY